MELSDIIRRNVLNNAVKHEGAANPKSVLGGILADNPELRTKVMEIRYMVEEEVEQINKWPLSKQKRELQTVGGVKIVEKKEEKKEFPELEIEREGFVARFAPNPDGALHMGNARPAIICNEYAKKYNGKLILRFDDTDPKIKTPEKRFYKWARDDLKWLGIKFNKEYTSSKRINIYYKYADELIQMGKAYVCICIVEKWRLLRDKRRACPCRSNDPKKNAKEWKLMLKHKYKEGEAVLRIKTDLDAKNPAVREWPAFRIVDNPIHPLVKRKHVWPLYNFASAIDDKLTGVTHIFRGQEHATNEVKQRYVYDYFGWKYPFTVILGRLSMSDMVLSKSKIREGIRIGEFTGWDDLRIGTLKSLKRRGFHPDTIVEMIKDIGPKPSDVTISFENLAGYNRKRVDKTSNRYFFVDDPKRIEIKNMNIKKITVPLHPENKKAGFRTFIITKNLFITAPDFKKYKGIEIRLKNFCNVKLDTIALFTGTEVKKMPKIQWITEKNIPVRILMSDKHVKGYGEVDLEKAKVGSVVQFERFGFVKIEKSSKTNIVAVFCHD